MKVTISRNIKHALLVEKGEIKLLQQSICEKYKHLLIVARCVDGTRLEVSEIDEIISYENSNSRKIKSLNFEATNSTEEILSLEIEASYSPSVKLNIKSDSDEEAILIVDKVLKRLNEMKPWYDYLTRFSIALVILLIFVFIGFIIQYLKWVGYVQSSVSQISIADFFNSSIYFSLMVLGILYVFDLIQNKLFPRVFFLIGKQKKAMERIIFWRKFLFGTIILSIIVNVFSNWISK